MNRFSLGSFPYYWRCRQDPSIRSGKSFFRGPPPPRRRLVRRNRLVVAVVVLLCRCRPSSTAVRKITGERVRSKCRNAAIVVVTGAENRRHFHTKTPSFVPIHRTTDAHDTSARRGRVRLAFCPDFYDVASPNVMANYRRVASSPLFTIRLLALLTAASGLLSVRSAAAGTEVRHVRHKRTVSDFMENLMNAVYGRIQDHDDDNDNVLPLPSTVIARFTHMPASGKVYK